MQLETWRQALADEGFTYHLQNPHGKDVREVFFYGPGGHLLTSAMVLTYRDIKGEPEGIAVYWLAETIGIAEDIAHLKAANERALQRVG